MLLSRIGPGRQAAAVVDGPQRVGFLLVLVDAAAALWGKVQDM